MNTDYTDEMNLWQRTWNTVSGLFVLAFRNWVVVPSGDPAAAHILADPSLPSISDIEKNVSLILTNTHLSMNYQFPKSAVFVEAGGLHCVTSKPLPTVLVILSFMCHGSIIINYHSVIVNCHSITIRQGVCLICTPTPGLIIPEWQIREGSGWSHFRSHLLDTFDQ